MCAALRQNVQFMYSNEMKDRKKILAGWLAENGDGKWYPRDWGALLANIVGNLTPVGHSFMAQFPRHKLTLKSTRMWE